MHTASSGKGAGRTPTALFWAYDVVLLGLHYQSYTPGVEHKAVHASQRSVTALMPWPLADLQPPRDHCTCRRLGLRNPKHPKCNEPAPSAPSHCVRTIDRASATNWPRLARKRRRLARSAEAVTPLAPVSAHSAPVSFPRSARSACPASSRSPALVPAPQHGSCHARHQ